MAALRLAGTPRRKPSKRKRRRRKPDPDPPDLDPAAREANATLAAARKAGILPARADDDGDEGDGDDAPTPRRNPPREEKGPVEEEADELLRNVPRTRRRR